MKSLFTTTLIALALLGCQKSVEQFDAAAMIARLDTIHAGFVECALKGDAAAYASYYDANAHYCLPNAPLITGRANIEKAFKGMIQPGIKITHLQIVPIAVEGAGDYAYEVGRYFQAVDVHGVVVADTGKYVSVWKKQTDGSWKMAADIWNTDLQPSTAQPSGAGKPKK